MGILDANVAGECPECGANLPIRLASVGNGATVTCARGHRVTLEIDSASQKSLREVKRAEKDLLNALKKLGR